MLKQLKDDFKKRIQKVIDLVQRQFGEESIRCLDSSSQTKMDVISSGSILLNHALGVGGYPKGRIVEIFGAESSGKTTLALHAIAETQKENGVCVFVDAEHALDLNYAKAIGVRCESLLISQPDYGEQALELSNLIASSGYADLIVIDSVAALVPKAEVEGEIGDVHVGLQARMMSQALRKLATTCAKSNTTVLFTNQLRNKIGVLFGSPETTPGGTALRFYATIRLELRRISTIKNGNEPVGNKVRARVVKNKVASPFQEVELELKFGVGIDKNAELLEAACMTGVVRKTGSWYSFHDKRLANGKENTISLLAHDSKLRDEIEKQVKLALFPSN